MWKLKEQMQHVHNVAWKHLNNSGKRQRELYDAKHNANQYDIGLETNASQLDRAQKL